jgi:ATP-binding cassette, subfamily C, bacterial exporter for protease/lipase
VGLLAPSAGKVRFNGVDAYQWDKAELGPHIGYLAQDIELLDGTLAENICRFGPVDSEQLQTVIQLLDLQTLIDSLPQGLDTPLGHEGEFLSGGRRQLVGLARAIYGKPAIVILDEPNANLDEAGERALHHMVSTLKHQGTTFVIISHLQGIKTIADYLMILMQGQVVRYGKPDEVMASLQPPSIPRPDKGTAAGARI